jgi:hypothetical protein
VTDGSQTNTYSAYPNGTRIYTFSLPKKDDGSHGVLGLPVGKHVQVAFHMADGVVMRPYTPIRPVLKSEEDGTFGKVIPNRVVDHSQPPCTNRPSCQGLLPGYI